MAKLHEPINVPITRFFPSSREWRRKAKELYEAAGEVWSSATSSFLRSLGELLFDGRPRLLTIGEIGGHVELGRSQTKEHLGRAERAGVLDKLASGWNGLKLQLMVLCERGTLTLVEQPSDEAAERDADTPPLTPEERRRAAEFAADEYEKRKGKADNRQRLVQKILRTMDDEEAREHLETMAAREKTKRTLDELEQKKRAAAEEQKRERAALHARLMAKLSTLGEGVQRTIQDAALQRLPEGPRALIRKAGGPERVTNELVREQFQEALLKELEARFGTAPAPGTT